jgi:hypothetical protein
MQVLGVDRRVHIFETVKTKIKEKGYSYLGCRSMGQGGHIPHFLGLKFRKCWIVCQHFSKDTLHTPTPHFANHLQCFPSPPLASPITKLAPSPTFQVPYNKFLNFLLPCYKFSFFLNVCQKGGGNFPLAPHRLLRPCTIETIVCLLLFVVLEDECMASVYSVKSQQWCNWEGTTI